MGRADNSHFLAQAAAERHEAAVRRAHTAIEHLDRTGQPITFCSVADTAGVSRAWLYRQADIRQTIASLRAARPAILPATPRAQHASIASLRQRLEAAQAELSRLRTENVTLRDQLARQLGEQRSHRIRPVS